MYSSKTYGSVYISQQDKIIQDFRVSSDSDSVIIKRDTKTDKVKAIGT